MSKHFRSDNETFNGEDKHQEQNHGEDINAKSILDKLRMTPTRYGNQMESQGNSNEGAKKVAARDIQQEPLCLPAKKGKPKKKRARREKAPKKDKSDAPRIRLDRKRFQEKRRRKEFREALDTLLATISRYDSDFSQEAKNREARMIGRMSYRSALSEDNPLFNRVEMVNQANFTIERLTEERKELEKELESLGGDLKAVKAGKDNSGVTYVFHQGVGPLASHEVPPIVPDIDVADDSKEDETKQKAALPPEAKEAEPSSIFLVDIPNNVEPASSRAVDILVDPPDTFVADNFSAQNMSDGQGDEVLNIHNLAQIEGQLRQPSNIADYQLLLASQYGTSILGPQVAALPSTGHQAQHHLSSQEATQLEMISDMMLGRLPPQLQHIQSQPEALDSESAYHRIIASIRYDSQQSRGAAP